MGTGRRAAGFILRPLPQRAIRLVHRRHRRSVRGLRAAGRDTVLYFRIDIGPSLERDGHWRAIGFFDLKEDFVSIGLGILPAYWVFWRRPLAGELGRTRAALTAILAFIVWWGFLVGHVMNNIMGFGS
jgi:hypothetical protein